MCYESGDTYLGKFTFSTLKQLYSGYFYVQTVAWTAYQNKSPMLAQDSNKTHNLFNI